MKLEWDVSDPGEARSFTIEKLTASNRWMETLSTPANNQIHHYEMYDNSPSGGENIYRLRIEPKSGHPFYSIQRRVIVKPDPSFTIYPNPAKDKLIIQGKLNAGTSIRLIDVNGKIIKQIITNASLNSYEFILPLLSPGIYVFNVDNYIEKIMILY